MRPCSKPLMACRFQLKLRNYDAVRQHACLVQQLHSLEPFLLHSFCDAFYPYARRT